MSGPPLREPPESFIELTEHALRFGLRGKVFASPALARTCCNGDSKRDALILSFTTGMDKLLVSDRADYAAFEFKHWFRINRRQRKDTMRRVRASLYQTKEHGLWVSLELAPSRGRSRG